MSDESKPGDLPEKKIKPKSDYEVGKGRPPKSGQFKPGQSGNPSGRRKRSARRQSHASVRVSRAMVWIVDGGKQVQVTAYEAMLLKLCFEALKGNRRAQTQILRDKVKFARVTQEAPVAERETGQLPVIVRDHAGRIVADRPPRGGPGSMLVEQRLLC